MRQSLAHALLAFVTAGQLGVVPFPPLRVRVGSGKIRMPDVLFLKSDHLSLRRNRAWDGADLAMEIVSPDPKDRQRDYQEKLADYAAGNIAEYWIVDAQRQVVQVHRLQGDAYGLHGEFAAGQQATSALLDGFAVDVEALFAVLKEIPE